MPRYGIDFNRSENYECGSILLALIASGGESDSAMILSKSLCAYAVRISDDEKKILVKPTYLRSDIDETDRDMRKLDKLLSDRSIAARMAFALINLEKGLPMPPLFPAGRFSVSAVAEFVLEDAGLSEVSNLKSRIWRPSLPVIHLAMALAQVQRASQPDHVINPTDYLFDPELTKIVITRAQELEPLVLANKKIAISEDQLVRVRLQ